MEINIRGLNRKILIAALSLDLLWVLSFFLPYFRSRPDVIASLAGAFLGVLLGQVYLLRRCLRLKLALDLEINLKKSHLLQSLAQSLSLSYWAFYWYKSWDRLPLVLAQLLLAYSLDGLFSLARRQKWQLGLGPVPIILSINFFLWFAEGHFYLQFLTVLLAFLGKEFIRWKGTGTHIFNPSAFPLTVVAIIIFVTGSFHLTKSIEVVNSFDVPPNMYEVIFFSGLIVQLAFPVVLVTLGAVSFLALKYLFFNFFLTSPQSWPVLLLASTYVPVSTNLLLACTLFITDPVTSPRTRAGKFLFGFIYTFAVSLVLLILRYTAGPTAFDKVFILPFLNLAVPWLDRLGGYLEGAIDSLKAKLSLPMLNLKYENLYHVGAYATLFLLLAVPLKAPRGIVSHAPRSPLEMPSPELARALQDTDRRFCGVRDSACAPFAFVNEIAIWLQH